PVQAGPHVTEHISSNSDENVGALLEIAVEMSGDIARTLPTEQDAWWFLAEQYDRTVNLGGLHLQLLEASSLKMHVIEYEGRRSEDSYVGKRNPGAAFLEQARRNLTAKLPDSLVDVVITQAFILFAEQNMPAIDALRIKYATHFHNNCVRSGAYNNAERWQDVIDEIESRRAGVGESTMHSFANPFYRSPSDDIEATYAEGVLAIQNGDFGTADHALRRAAAGGHVSALYNLAILHGNGLASPWDPEFGIECFYKAADAGHPNASKGRWMMEGADRGGFGTDNLTRFASQMSPEDGLDAMIMLCACRFIEVLCRQHDATDAVIAYELDAASISDDPAVLRYVERTGMAHHFYDGGLNRLEPGSAADQITDALNNFSVAMKRAGFDKRMVIVARCTIIGHLIRVSRHGSRCKPLLGVQQFLAAR
ncbi:MAG TPA: hypothetical protein H9899_16385, partial [Candidatus Sphingomonas excrementigallinarum]|nr:hypothetical protein [Candidatus Sphingomonas excrementigallinarum]